jgi:hypothetical protein
MPTPRAFDETRPAFNHAKMVGAIPDTPSPMPNHDTEEKGWMKMLGLLLTAHKADWVCLHVGRRPVILYLRRDGPVPVAGVVVDHVLFVERLLPVQDVRHARPV